MTQTDRQPAYVFWDITKSAAAVLRDSRFEQFSERHHYRPNEELKLFSSAGLEDETRRANAVGVVFLVHSGVPGNILIDAGKRALKRGLKAYYFWPQEDAVEVIDHERLRTFRNLWVAQKVYARMRGGLERRAAKRQATAGGAAGVGRATPSELVANAEQIASESKGVQAHVASGVSWISSTGLGLVQQIRAHAPLPASDSAPINATIDQIEEHLKGVAAHFSNAQPALSRVEQLAETTKAMAANLELAPALTQSVVRSKLTQEGAIAECRALRGSAKSRKVELRASDGTGKPVSGMGAYVRLDFWEALVTGGSYGHTVYQCRALAKSCDDFVAIVANRFPTLDKVGVRQELIRAASHEGNEENLIDANRFFYEQLRLALAAIRPAFVFERLVPASYVCAKVCQELNIPYIAEYNGSELSMMKSFQGKTTPLQDLYIAAENFAFEQASTISVVSDNVAADLIGRGVPASKILVNANAVDLEAYQPGSPIEVASLRTELGLGASDRVIGFIGTFGGWHGLDVLAEALPKICEANPAAKFLLIGDGSHKHLIRGAIEKHGLASRVIDRGRVPQQEGARLLKACDILVSPHSVHMVDSKFFGSPTKLFEYMALGAGIVASDLEQIGAILRPAIAPDHRPDQPVRNERAVLSVPGDVDSFVAGVNLLVRHPQICEALGANAREAARKYYTWDQHVADLWAFASGRPLGGMAADLKAKVAETA